MNYKPIDDQLYTKITQSHPSSDWKIEQSPVWGKFQNQIPGRHDLGAFLVQKDGQDAAICRLILMEMNGYSYVWINNGPILLEEAVDIQELLATLRKLVTAEVKGTPLFIRLQLSGNAPDILRPAYTHSIPERTTIVDLTKDFDELLAAMSQNARQGMRKSQKQAVEIRELPAVETAQQFEPFYQIMAETAKRGGFYAHPIATYQAMLTTLGEHVRFFAAYQDNAPTAWAIITTYNHLAVYYYGASNTAARDSMAPYLLHIEIMKTLKQEGMRSYDFFGISSDRNPGWAGVTQFKMKFGGEVVDYAPAYDLPLKPLRYKSWKLALEIKDKLR